MTVRVQSLVVLESRDLGADFILGGFICSAGCIMRTLALTTNAGEVGRTEVEVMADGCGVDLHGGARAVVRHPFLNLKLSGHDDRLPAAHAVHHVHGQSAEAPYGIPVGADIHPRVLLRVETACGGGQAEARGNGAVVEQMGLGVFADESSEGDVLRHGMLLRVSHPRGSWNGEDGTGAPEMRGVSTVPLVMRCRSSRSPKCG